VTGVQGFSSWRPAFARALYGPDGFYTGTRRPVSHYRTSPTASPRFAAAIARLLAAVDASLDRPPRLDVVDMGAGGGELLAGLAALAVPERWQLTAVDVLDRPDALPERVAWQPEPPERIVGVVVANEWLDNVPVEVVEQTAGGPRIIEVTRTGAERVGPLPDVEDERWLRRWWPLTRVGQRAEVGRDRDAAWAGLMGRLECGVAVAVDYPVVPASAPTGTLTGFRDGRQVPPVPDASTDLTAAVLFGSLVAARDSAAGPAGGPSGPGARRRPTPAAHGRHRPAGLSARARDGR